MPKDNKLEPDQCVKTVESYFAVFLPDFMLRKKVNYTGWWWIEFASNENTRIIFEGDIGGHFKVIISVDGSETQLWSFDPSVNSYTKSTSANLKYQLKILKRFLS
jgi:hypothetical protein